MVLTAATIGSHPLRNVKGYLSYDCRVRIPTNHFIPFIMIVLQIVVIIYMSNCMGIQCMYVKIIVLFIQAMQWYSTGILFVYYGRK